MQRMNAEYQGLRKKLKPYVLCARLTIVLVRKVRSQPQYPKNRLTTASQTMSGVLI
jgi:hypothetical protein